VTLYAVGPNFIIADLLHASDKSAALKYAAVKIESLEEYQG